MCIKWECASSGELRYATSVVIESFACTMMSGRPDSEYEQCDKRILKADVPIYLGAFPPPGFIHFSPEPADSERFESYHKYGHRLNSRCIRVHN